IGNGKHKPNLDAIQYLYGDIWPRIKKLLPEARISIYGAYLPDHIKALHKPKMGFHVKGYVEDAQLIMRKARVNLIPLRYGAGLKGKLLLAYENGTPSVCTAAGIEGYLKTDSEDLHSFNEADDFANEAVRLYTNKEVWLQKQQEGYLIVESSFGGKEIKDSFLEALTKLGNQLNEHRMGNFTGSMLWHHSMQSTKYLSKWISLKNQIKSPDRAT
ncbi:MAG: glycosyltransferase family 4 protein, partial [Eudoraea sp.]|nr:glycosyltransferase family 4 protein [Eudoraea sp.]